MEYMITVYGREFELIQHQISDEAYEYWSDKSKDELEGYVFDADDIREQTPEYARFIEEDLQFYDMDFNAEKYGSYFTPSSIEVSLDGVRVFEEDDPDYEEYDEWYDQFLPAGNYFEAYYENKGSREWVLNIDEEFDPEKLVIHTVDWNDINLVVQITYDDVELEQVDSNTVGKASSARVFVGGGR